MEGSFLRFYVTEGHRLQGVPLWDRVLRTANGIGIRGGSAFRAIARNRRQHVRTRIASSSWLAAWLLRSSSSSPRTNADVIDQSQYSAIVEAVIAGTVVPALIAHTFLLPRHLLAPRAEEPPPAVEPTPHSTGRMS
jgi:hypothetical protein